MEQIMITISTQIASGNLGDGWRDENEAAMALARFTQETWARDVAELAAQGHRINIDVEVLRNTSGSVRGMVVETDDYEMTQRVEFILTPSAVIWDRFCGSQLALELAA